MYLTDQFVKFPMKNVFLVIIFLLITLSNVKAKKIEGLIILNNDETLEVTFIIPFGFLSPEPSYLKLQTRVRYIDSSNQKKVLKPDDAKEISFMHNGYEIRMLSVQDDLQLSSLFSSQTKVFLKLEIDGNLKLFNSYATQQSPGMYNASMGMSTGGYSYSVERYVLQKGNGELFRPRGISFRKDMSAFFSDCPELVQKIQNKDFRKGDLELIVKEYNKKCVD